METKSEDLILKAQIINQIIDTNIFVSALVKSKAKRFLEELILEGSELKKDMGFKKIMLTATPDVSKLSEIDKLF